MLYQSQITSTEGKLFSSYLTLRNGFIQSYRSETKQKTEALYKGKACES